MSDIESFLKRLGAEIESIVKSCFDLSYFSRGAWPYHHVLTMTQAERQIAADLINERLKIAEKSMFPVY